MHETNRLLLAQFLAITKIAKTVMTAKKYLIETRTNNAGKYTYVRTSDFFYVQNESLKLCCFNLKSCCRFDVTDALTTQQRQDGRLACPCGHTMHSYKLHRVCITCCDHTSQLCVFQVCYLAKIGLYF